MKTNMRDRELSTWTSKGPKHGGYYVATIGDIVVGMMAYKVSTDELEMFRVHTNRQFRKLGVATTILRKVELIANELGCKSVKALTTDAQIEAVKFYSSHSYNIVKKVPYCAHGTDFLNLLTFKKDI